MPVLNDVASSLNGARDESDQNQNQPETSNSDPCAQVEVKAALIGDNIIFATLPVEGSGEAAGEPGLHSVSASLPELSIESTENIPNSNFDAKLDGFWYDRTSVYAFGQSGNVIEYDTSKDNGWQTVQLDQVDIPTGSMTSDPSYGRSIAAKLDAGSTTITVFDTSANEPKIRTLNPPPSGPNQLAREDEAVFFLPIGKSGALVVLGGQHWEPGSTGPVDLPLTDIDFLDIEAGKWTKVVLTTPDASKVPGARSKFCGWVVPSQDGKSFSIVIHGGRTADATGQPIIYGDVWSLSVPAFTWTKIRHSNALDDNALGEFEKRHQRYNHVCLKHGDSFGIALGGSSTPETTGSCKRQTSGAPGDTSVIDFSTFQLVDEWDLTQNNPPFSDPGASTPNPSIPAEITALFQTTLAPAPTLTASPTNSPIPTTTTTATAHADSSPSRLSTGAIAGIVLGVLVALILALTAALFFLRRHRRHHRQRLTVPPKPASTSASDTDEAGTYVSGHPYDPGHEYRRSLSPQHESTAASTQHIYAEDATYGGGGQTAIGQMAATHLPAYEVGASRTFTRDELDSPTSAYSSSLLEDHDGRNREGSLARRMSDVSSLAETVVEDEREVGARRGRQGEGGGGKGRSRGDVSPVVSPIAGMEQGFNMDGLVRNS